jgi:hypothetical protein
MLTAAAAAGGSSAAGSAGILASLFGGSGIGYGAAGSLIPAGPFPYASGTDYHPGGMAIVGERGRELVNLPRGAQVVPNDILRAQAAKRGGGQTIIHAPVNITVPNGTSAASAGQIGAEAARHLQRAAARR